MQRAGAQAMDETRQGYGRAEAGFDPYKQGGAQAFNQQMALSGALGQDAFNSANMESPYTAFLREQGMRANLAGASATGGLGGGNVQKELQRFGQGLASQGLQQQFNNLGSMSGMGMNATQGAANIAMSGANALSGIGMNTASNVAGQRGQQAGFEGQTGAGLANINMQTAGNIAGQRGQQAGNETQAGINMANLGMQTAEGINAQRGQQAGYQSDAATNLANIGTQEAINISNQRGEQAGYGERAGVNLGNIATQGALNIANQRGTQADYTAQAGTGITNLGIQNGTSIANMQYGTAQDIASQRARAGELLAGQYGNASANMGNLLNDQGTGLSGMIYDQYGNLIKANNVAANTAAGNQVNLAGGVGDLQTGYGTNVANAYNGQQTYNGQPQSYADQFGNVLNAGGTGWELGNQAVNATQNGSNIPIVNSQPSYVRQTATGSGTYNLGNLG